MNILKKHYDPEPIVITKRFRFFQRSQSHGESIGNYLANLRQLASCCKFGNFLHEALCDHLVRGMQSKHIQKVLLTKANLTLEQALEISQGMEAATLQSKELKGSQQAGAVLAVGAPESSSVLTIGGPEKPCGCCGVELTVACKFRNATCHKCGKMGHIAPVCR